MQDIGASYKRRKRGGDEPPPMAALAIADGSVSATAAPSNLPIEVIEPVVDPS